MSKLTIGISAPCYNEFNNIDFFIESIIKLKKNYNVYLCIVDDESIDGTLKKIYLYKKKYKFIYLIKRKKKLTSQVYSAYHDGLKKLSRNKKINFFSQLDTDNVCTFKDILLGFNKISENKNTGCVILSKYLNKKKILRSFIRKVLSKLYTKVCQAFFGAKLTDYSTGIRFYNRSTLELIINRKLIFLSPIGLLDDLLFLIKNNIKIMELPFNLKDRIYGKSLFEYKTVIYMAYEFILCVYKNLNLKK